jgi:hypothetical protein
MTLITFQGGKPVLRDGKVGTEQACCCGCIPCACEKAVDYTFNQRGKWELGDTPPEPTEGEATAYNASDSCYLQTLTPCQTCFDFDIVPDGDICVCGNGGCYEGFEPVDFIICEFTDNPDVRDPPPIWWVSVELAPCMRLLCNAAGEYTLEVCQLQYCAGAGSNRGRLTKRSFSIVLDETGCPESLGDELTSSVSDWYGPDGGCQWKPLTEPHPIFNIDSDYCNKDCWQGINMDTVAIRDLNPLP